MLGSWEGLGPSGHCHPPTPPPPTRGTSVPGDGREQLPPCQGVVQPHGDRSG